jgi:modulator of FtsH protease
MFEQNNNPAHTQTKVGIEPTFFGKVMTFFALGILSSAVGVLVTMQYFMTYLNSAPYLIWILFAVELVLIFTSRSWSRKIPLNRVLYAAFTFITGVTIAPIIAVYAASPELAPLLYKALFVTALLFTAVAIFGWTTKINLQGLRGFLIMGLLGMIVVGILGIFFPWGSTMELMFSGAGVLLFSAFTMYDFQKLKNYPEDRYIEAAISLYLDIFNLFLYVLRLLTSLSRN